MKRYRWNKRKCADNLLALAAMVGTAALLVWITAVWVLTA